MTTLSCAEYDWIYPSHIEYADPMQYCDYITNVNNLIHFKYNNKICLEMTQNQYFLLTFFWQLLFFRSHLPN